MAFGPAFSTAKGYIMCDFCLKRPSYVLISLNFDEKSFYIHIRFIQTKMFVLVTCIHTIFYIHVHTDSPSFVAFHPFSFDARSAPMCLCILHGEGAETLQATLELGHLEFSKSHSVLSEQILLSFTNAKMSREDFGKKLVALTADGAAVNGTQRASRPVCAPFQGPVGNLGKSLQDFKKEWTQENLLFTWCWSHRVDLVAKKFEDVEAMAPVHISMLRRLCSHISNSSHGAACCGQSHPF